MPRVRKGQSTSWMVVVVVAIVLAIAVIAVIYMRTMGAMNAMATLTGSGTITSDGSLTLTVTASGGAVRINGIVLLNSSGVVTVIGTTPGYTAPLTQTCILTGVYINSASGGLTPPWVLQNGQSASFIFTAQSATSTSTPIRIIASLDAGTSGCGSVSQAIIFYNSGKESIISIMG